MKLVPARIERWRAALAAGWRRLSVRVAASAALAALAVAAAVGTVYLHLLEQRLLSQVGEQVRTAAERLAEDLNERMRTRIRALEAAASHFNQEGYGVDAEGATELLAEHGATLAVLFDRVVVVGADGRALAVQPRAGPWRGLDVSAREYFQRARDTGRLVVSEPVVGALTRAPIITLAAPLLDRKGEFGGVLIGALNLGASEALAPVREARLGSSGHFFALTRGGKVLLHPDPERVLQPVPEAATDPGLAAAVRGWRGWLHVQSPAAVAGIDAYAPLHYAPWIVGARLPEREALAPLRQARLLAVAAAAVSVVALAAVMWLVAGVNLRPLSRLATEIAELQAGRRSGRVTVDGTDEIRAVAEGFNELQRAQQDLRDAMAAREAFHRSLNESTPLGVFVADDGGEWRYVNRRLEQMLGRRAELLHGSGWLGCVHPQEREAVRREWEAALRGNRPLATRWRLRVDGDTLWVQAHMQPLPEGAEVGGFVGAIADVTAEQRAIERAERERERAARIVEAMADAIVVMDECGCVEHFNAAAERLTGWKREAALNLPAAHVLRLLDEGGAGVDIAALLAGPTAARDDLVYERAGGVRVPVDLYWQPGAVAVGAGRGGVLVLRDASGRREKSRMLAWQARHDALTGLANRRAFEEASAARYEAFATSGVNTALALIDLDWFKRVNDEGGHDAGDEMLRKVAAVLRAHVRESDIAARLGGDEFALLLPGCAIGPAQAIAQRVATDIAALRVERGGREFRIGASVGIAAFALGDEDSQSIVKRADAACYSAKHAGRNRVVVEDVGVTAEVELF